MSERLKRTPQGYDGTTPTSHKLQDMLSLVVRKLEKTSSINPNLIFALWPDLVGKQFAQITRPERIEKGVLYVRVANSTALSLLNNSQNKEKILCLLQEKVKHSYIEKIIFKIGS